MKQLCTSFVLLVLLALLSSACSTVGTTIQPHAVEHHIDTISVVRNRIDSVYIKDSIYIHQRGDTVFSEKWHTRYKYKYIYRDSLHIRIDSIPYPVEVIKEVKYTPKLTKGLAGVGGIVIMLLIAFCIIRTYEAFH